MPQKLQNITNTDFLINENRTDFEKTREILRSYPVPLTECARMMCSFLFAAFVSCLQRSFFICSVRFLLTAFLLFAAYIFKLQFSFLICSVLFHLQRSFLFAAFLFCLQRFFFVCSMSLVGHRRRLNILRLSHKVVTLPPWLTMSSLPVTTSNGTILISSLPESPTYSAKLKKLF